MTPREIARRYAEALYAAAEDDGALRITGNLDEVCATLRDVPRLRRWMEHPLVSREAKQQFLRQAFPDVATPTARALALLVQNGRERLIEIVAEEFAAVSAERAGLVPVVIATARALDEDERSRLKDRLEKSLGRPVRMSERVDRSLIAGVRVETMGRVLDGSVRASLERLRVALGEGGEG
ncbi:MAG: ATP synthase F1 subunit delta [Candidatus Bipolaricaulota bacterium]